MANIKKSCYFITDEKQIIRAICEKCTSKSPENQRGWFWNGQKSGYGDYDLNCFLCDDVIHKRDKNDK